MPATRAPKHFLATPGLAPSGAPSGFSLVYGAMVLNRVCMIRFDHSPLLPDADLCPNQTCLQDVHFLSAGPISHVFVICQFLPENQFDKNNRHGVYCDLTKNLFADILLLLCAYLAWLLDVQ